MKKFLIILLGLLFTKCTVKHSSGIMEEADRDFTLDTITYTDQDRNRNIPVAIYKPKDKAMANHIPIIFSHGYGENKGGDYLKYSYLTESLASK